MITLIFIILLIAVTGKLLIWSLKAAWGLTKILLTVVLFPIVLIAMAGAGLVSLAIVFLVIAGIVLLVETAVA